MSDFEIEDIHAPGILENTGFECNGFNNMHETGQPEGNGGYGWAQWTGPRRKQFFQWCADNHLHWENDKANYGFLKYELTSTERSAIPALLKTATPVAAVSAFERNYERAGVPNYKPRNQWASVALQAYNLA